jgi:uncharacterized protein YjbJ (UPF0337 family)
MHVRTTENECLFVRANSPLSFGYERAVIVRRRTTMTTGNEDQLKGKTHEVKGAIKEKIGQVTNDASLEAEGPDENTGGKIQKKVGEIKKVFGK